MTNYGSGLSAQLMAKAETTVGTAVTVDTAYEFLNESFQYVPNFIDGAGLKAGQAYKRASRTVRSSIDVTGDFAVEHGDAGHMGLLWKHALGAAAGPTQIGVTTAYKSIITPGSHAGLGLTVQVGRPQPDATVKAFTYSGVKVEGWEFSCSDQQYAQLKLTCNGWNATTATALAAASYTAGAGIFSFADCTNITLGGTVTTATGLTSIAGGVALSTLARGITLTGSTPMANQRYGLGNSGIKKEQIENAIPTITGSLDAEFTSRTEIYDLFAANTNTALQVDFTHGDAGSSNPFKVSFILPSVKFKMAAVNVAGPDIVPQKIDFEAYDDGTNPVIQVVLVSTDTTL